MKKRAALRSLLVASVLTFPALTSPVHAGAFMFAGEANGIGIITHPSGYGGAGGSFQVNICIDPTSPSAADMVVPVQNIIDTMNRLWSIPDNVEFGSLSGYDFESVALHEVGHCIGLAHPNLGSGKSVSSDYTNSTDGANDYDAAAGTDAIIGSNDDGRGDDVNLTWFRKIDNDPFALSSTFDTSTYSRDPIDLPSGHVFAANASRDVATLLGYGSSEAVMQQGSYYNEMQRDLSADDEASLRLAMSGRDAIEGTADDYTYELVYAGLTSGGSCDVTLELDNTTSFARCSVGGTWVGPNHFSITTGSATFNQNQNWFFTTVRRELQYDRFEAADLSQWD